MKQAILYDQLDNNLVQCKLCSHRCKIPDGKKGKCGVRQNNLGKLYALSYGKLIAADIDPIEKKPLFHFLPGTKAFSIAGPGCNFTCKFCQNWQDSQIVRETGEIVGQDWSPEEVVERAVDFKCQSIAYTYTEPTIFLEYVLDVAKLAKEKGLKNLMVTNGFQTQHTIEKMAGLIDAANIDLKSFSDKYYKEVCGGRLKPVKEAIKIMWEIGIWVEVTTLIVPKLNDSKKELIQIAEFLAGISPEIVWHVTRFYPQYQMTDTPPTEIKTIEQAVKIGKKAGLKYVYAGNVMSNEHTVCPNCKNIVIERYGYAVKSFLKNDQCPFCQQKIFGVFK